MLEQIKELTRSEAPTREVQEAQEDRVKRMGDKAEGFNLPGYRGTDSSYSYWSGRFSQAEQKLEDMKGKSREEAERLNHELDRLKTRMEEAIKEFEEFESKLNN